MYIGLFFSLFRQFGTLKFVRLPKKMGSDGEHRGFAFVEYLTKGDAKVFIIYFFKHI